MSGSPGERNQLVIGMKNYRFVLGMPARVLCDKNTYKMDNFASLSLSLSLNQRRGRMRDLFSPSVTITIERQRRLNVTASRDPWLINFCNVPLASIPLPLGRRRQQRLGSESYRVLSTIRARFHSRVSAFHAGWRRGDFVTSFFLSLPEVGSSTWLSYFEERENRSNGGDKIEDEIEMQILRQKDARIYDLAKTKDAENTFLSVRFSQWNSSLHEVDFISVFFVLTRQPFAIAQPAPLLAPI